MNSLISLTPQQLRQAADIQERIATLQQQLGRLLGDVTAAAVSGASTRRKISAAGLARIRAAQRARWAKVRSTNRRGAAAQTSGKRKMSAAARAKIGEKMRAIWAARKAGR